MLSLLAVIAAATCKTNIFAFYKLLSMVKMLKFGSVLQITRFCPKFFSTSD